MAVPPAYYLQMKAIIQFIQEIIQQILRQVEAKNELKKHFPFCRLTVESQIFAGLLNPLMMAYRFKHQEKEARFANSQEAILRQQSILQVLKFLDIKPRYWLISKEEIEKHSSLGSHLPLPYCLAIEELNKLDKFDKPREKLKVVTAMLCLMRLSVIEFSKGNLRLGSMDDELPIIIYIVLMSRVK